MIIKLSILTFKTEIYKFESKSDQNLKTRGINLYSYLISKIKHLINKFIFNLDYFERFRLIS